MKMARMKNPRKEKPKEDMEEISENKVEISDIKEPNKEEIKSLEIIEISKVDEPEKEGDDKLKGRKINQKIKNETIPDKNNKIETEKNEEPKIDNLEEKNTDDKSRLVNDKIDEEKQMKNKIKKKIK